MSSGKLTALTAALLLSSAAARADISIDNKPTSNMNCSGGVCTATAQKAVLNVSDLANMLASGDVAVKTALVAKDIDIDQPLTWTSASRLTLDAQQSVSVNKQVTVAGQGALTVATNDNGQPKSKSKTGEFIIVPEHGSVQFWDLGSNLIIDGNTYTLVGDIKTLAADIADNPSGFYALAKDYDASVDGTYSTSPIHVPLQGAFEGLGNEIVSVSIDSTIKGDYVGFFDGIDTGGTVRDFRIAQEDMQAQEANGIGLLAAGNYGQIVRCRVDGVISFPVTVAAGGLVGENGGSVVDSSSSVRITGAGGRETVGGFVGRSYGSIAWSYSLHAVAMRRGAELNVGGLAGESSGTINNSFSRTRVNDGKENDNGYFGGLVGQNDSGAQIKSAYAAGEIVQHGAGYLGGFVGYDAARAGSISHAYWDLDKGVSDPNQGAGNIPNDPGITGLTTAQLRSRLPKGFDSKIWAIDPKINGGFPYLLALPPK